MNIAVVIVTYNSAQEIAPCLDACLSNEEGLITSIVVVDNHSEDETVAKVAGRPTVRLIANPVNRGFAAAVNQALAATSEDFILLLNPDATICGGLRALVAACSPTEVGASGGRLIGNDGREQRGFQVRRFPTVASLCFEALGLNRIWPGNPVNRHYRCLDLSTREAVDVDQPAGAFLLFRRSCWSVVGGFDEGYWPLWFEDVDFLRRVKAAGFRIRYEPQAVASHRGAHSLATLSWGSRQLYWYGNLLRYTALHFGLWGRLGVCLAVMVGAVLRAVTGMVQRRPARAIAVYGEVVRLAAATAAGVRVSLVPPGLRGGITQQFEECGSSSSLSLLRKSSLNAHDF